MENWLLRRYFLARGSLAEIKLQRAKLTDVVQLAVRADPPSVFCDLYLYFKTRPHSACPEPPRSEYRRWPFFQFVRSGIFVRIPSWIVRSVSARISNLFGRCDLQHFF